LERSRESSSYSDEDNKPRRTGKKKMRRTKKSGLEAKRARKEPNEKDGESDSEKIRRLRAEQTGKRGRPVTTGEYVKLAAAKKAVNDEERERRGA